MEISLRDIRTRLAAALAKPLSLEHRRFLHPMYLLRLVVEIGRNWAANRSPQQAANLTFQTALSIVPTIAISFSLLQWSGMLTAQSALVDFFSHHVLPVSGEDLADKLLKFAANVRTGSGAGVGVIVPLILAFTLYNSIERIFNDIWRVGKRRTLWAKFWSFIPLAIVVPVAAGFALYNTAMFWKEGGLAGAGAGVLVSFVGLFAANALIPRTPVNWRAAAAGALVSAIFFEAAKWGFQLYVRLIASASYEGVYGQLGIIPILLVWIYYSWLVILFGAEVAYSVQNLDLIEEQRRKHQSGIELKEELARKVNGQVAARLMLAIADHFNRCCGPMPIECLVQQYQLSSAVVEEICLKLMARGILVAANADAAEVMPGMPLDRLKIADVYSVFAQETVDNAPTDALTALQQRVDSARGDVLHDVTIADLLKRPESERTPQQLHA